MGVGAIATAVAAVIGISVTMDGAHVCGSPWDLTVSPAETNARSSYVCLRAPADRTSHAPPTETPVDVPHEMSDTEFRVAVSLGRAAYNKLFNYHQRLVYFEVNKLVNSNWQRATVMEKAW